MSTTEASDGPVPGWFRLEPGPGPTSWRFAVTPATVTPAGAVQGGALMGALVEALERTTGRPLVWATARYLHHAGPAALVEIEVTTDVDGHVTTQASARGTVDGVEVASAWGACGARPFPAEGVWATPPHPIGPPASSPPVVIAVPGHTTGRSMVEMLAPRLALGRLPQDLPDPPAAGRGRTAIWLRLPGGPRPPDAADLALLADFAMLAGSEAIGRRCTGNSLDNTLRMVGRHVTTDVLLDVDVVAVADGYGQFESRLWTDDGRLLAVASTSLVLRLAGTDGQSSRTTRPIVGTDPAAQASR